jgi:putative ABC transport system substrate-binding protein
LTVCGRSRSVAPNKSEEGETFREANFSRLHRAVLAVGTLSALAQTQQPKLPRVAYVWIFKEGPSAPYESAFREGMKRLGWVDGKTVIIEPRDAQGSQEKLAAIMRELVDSKVDVIVTACTPEARAAAKADEVIR